MRYSPEKKRRRLVMVMVVVEMKGIKERKVKHLGLMMEE